MISVEAAEQIILKRTKDYGNESIAFEVAVGRVLAEDIKADRDLPPFNRVAMDGIALRYEAIEKGITNFHSKGIQAAGDAPLLIEKIDECVEIMTGCALPPSADTVVRYEDVSLDNGVATLLVDSIKKGQNIHTKGADKKQNEIVAAAAQVITPAIINIAASVGATQVCVKKLPKVVVISTGNELVAPHMQPGASQIRQSNNYTVQAALKAFGIEAHLLHLQDDAAQMKKALEQCLQQYDVLVVSGGVSAGKFDYLPQALEAAGVEMLFHKVAQKPGKPFWFGEAKNGVPVFAFPGNPVSTFLCLHRFLIPWLKASLGFQKTTYHAVLKEDINFIPALQYFLPVKLQLNENAQLTALPVTGNGSGDLVQLAESNAFIELPAENEQFKSGELFKVWPFEKLV